jgi:hypothetical protein
MLDPTNARKAAERKARYRARQRAGIAVYRIEIGADVLDMLVRLRWLDDEPTTRGKFQPR